MDSLSSGRSLVSIRICLVIGLRLRLTGLIACFRNSGAFVGFDLYTIYDSPWFELGKVR